MNEDELDILKQGESETVEFKESFRDDALKQVFYDLEIIERYGSGIYRMLDACAAAGLPEPDLEESTGGFRMTFQKAAPAQDETSAEGTKLALSRHQVDDTATPQVAPHVAPQVGGQVAMLEQAFAAATGQVTGQVAGQVLKFCQHPQPAKKIQELLNLKHRETFLNNYLNPLLRSGWIEPTIPDKPRSRLQQYRLTERGRAVLATVSKKAEE